MSIWSYSEFLSVYKIYAFMKKVLKEKGNVYFKAVAVQICIARVSERKDFIESIE